MFINIKELGVEWEVYSFHSTSIMVVFILDYISLLFGGLVALISGSVLVYSTSYIRNETFFRRFISLVLLFVCSIILLIFRPNLISLLLGWDGLGVTSYLLVIFYQSRKSYSAGIVTALTNRMGDVGLLVCLSLILSAGRWNFFYYTYIFMPIRYYFCFILILSACTKRAQIPFSSWLPAAIAAPTPVSALVHSSTLVTAGVYLIIRFNYLITFNINSIFLLTLGGLTIIMAGLAALFEIDLKKIIALSTLSQLGVIIIISGGGFVSLSFFHLVSHAYFKAILFICAGILIHNIKDYQDIRAMGQGAVSIPVTISVIIIANIRLCGLPFTRGFYSKDLILEVIFIGSHGLFIFIILLLGTALTLVYSVRTVLLVCLSLVNAENIHFIEDNDLFMHGGIIILMPFALIGGIALSWYLLPSIPFIFLPFWISSTINFIIISARIIVIQLYYISPFFSSGKFKYFLANIWFMPTTFSPRLNLSAIAYGKWGFLINDSAWNELWIYKYLYISLKKLSKVFEYLNKGYHLNSFIILLLTLILFSALL